MVQTLHHHAGSVAEQAGLVVVTVGGMTLHLELIPCPGVDLVLVRPQRIELKQDSNRFTRHHPTTDSDRDVFFQLSTFNFPLFEKIAIFSKIDITMVSEVGTEEEHFVGVFGLHGSGTGAQYGIDTAYAVAHFP